MGSRAQALRSLLASSRGAETLTDERRQELADHLEDAVEAKVTAGAGELDAVVEAFRELGDVRAIAAAYPRPWSPAAMTSGLFGYAALAALTLFTVFISPKAYEASRGAETSLPGALNFLLRLGGPVGHYWPAFLLVPPVLGVLAWRFAGPKTQRVGAFAFAAAAMLALVGHVFGATIPLAMR